MDVSDGDDPPVIIQVWDGINELLVRNGGNV